MILAISCLALEEVIEKFKTLLGKLFFDFLRAKMARSRSENFGSFSIYFDDKNHPDLKTLFWH
jgi:hypothetical protein